MESLLGGLVDFIEVGGGVIGLTGLTGLIGLIFCISYLVAKMGDFNGLFTDGGEA
jgi:hypothetical protein